MPLLFIALAGWAMADPPPPAAPPIIVIHSADIEVTTLGYCTTRDGRHLDLRRTMFLANDALDFDAPGGPFRARIEGPKLLVDAIGERSNHSTYFNRIDYQIEHDDHRNLDIRVQLAWIEGRLAVYWRETYQNRIYRQGFYAIVGQGVEFICAGEGGITSAD